MAYEELKQRQSVMWGNGPYQRVTETLDGHPRAGDRAPLPPQRATAGSTSPAARARLPSARRRPAPT